MSTQQSLNDSFDSSSDVTPSRSTSKLETLSRDDLLKFVKKQMLLMQKTKSRCEELTKELDNSKKCEASAETSDVSALAEEHRELLEAYNQAQQALEQSAAKISSLTEQMDCMSQKLETVTALYQAMQNDFDALSLDNKKLHQESKSWALQFEHCSAMERTIDEQKQLSESKLRETQQLELALTESNEALKLSNHKFEALENNYNKVHAELSECLAEKRNLEHEVLTIPEALSVKTDLLDNLTKNTDSGRMELGELQGALKSALELSDRLSEEKEQICHEYNSLKLQLENSSTSSIELAREKEALESALNHLETAYEEQGLRCSKAVDECNGLVLNLEDAVREKTDLHEMNERYQAQVMELQSSIEELNVLNESYKAKSEYLLEQIQVCDKMLENPEYRVETNESHASAAQNEVVCLLIKIQSRVADLSNELSETRKQKVALEQIQFELENDNQNLSSELFAEKLRCEQLSSQVDQLSKELSCLEETRVKLIARCDEYQLKVDAVSDQLDGHNTAVSDSNIEPTNLRTAVLVIDEESNDRCDTTGEKNYEIELLKKEIEALKLKLAASVENYEETCIAKDVTPQVGNQIPMSACHVVEDSLCISQQDTGSQSVNTNETGNSELIAARQKLAEWEAMMLMLQTERNDVQKELTKLQQLQNKALNAASDLVQYVLDTVLKDRDIYPSLDSNGVEDECGVVSKLSLLRSVVEEMGFERDEMKEKIHQLAEEVGDFKTRNSDIVCDNGKLSEELANMVHALELEQTSKNQLLEKQAELWSVLELATSTEADLRRKLEEKETRVEELSVAIAEAQQLKLDLENMRLELIERDKMIAKESAENERFISLTEELRHQLESFKSNSGSSELELCSLKDELERMMRANSVLSEQVAELSAAEVRHKAQLTEVETKYEDGCRRASSLHDSVARLEEKLETGTEQTDLLEKQLVESHQEIEHLLTVKEELSSRVSKLEDRLSSAEADVGNLSSVKLSLEENVVALQTQLDSNLKSAGDRLANGSAELMQLQAQIADRDDSLLHMKDEIRLLQCDMQSKEEELKACQLDLQKNCSSLRNVEVELENKVLELDEVQAALSRASEAKDSILTKVANMEQQLKEHEDRETKLKQLALKAKKETSDTRSKLEACEKELEVAHQELKKTESNADQSLNYQTEYDQLETKFDTEKRRASDLEGSLKKAAEELSTLRMSHAEWMEDKDRLRRDIDTLELDKKHLENRIAEKDRENRAEVMLREQIYREKLEMESRISTLQFSIKDQEETWEKKEKNLQDQLRDLREKLNAAQRDAQQNNMMDLEIADYERTVQTLHATVANHDRRIQELQDELKGKENQCTALQRLVDSAEAQFAQAEDHSNKLKQLLMKAKKDLAKAKKTENEQKTVDAQLKGQVEMLTQITEEQKLQLASLLSENQRLTSKVQSMSENSHRTTQSLEQKAQSLEHDLEHARIELSSVQSEFESYKARVHSVLKQQKIKSSVEATVERERVECQRLEKIVEQLRSQLQEQREQMKSLTVENQLIQEEHERLKQRYTKLVADADQTERLWRERVERLNAENATNSTLKMETIQQLTASNDSLTQTFKEQIRALKEEYGHTIDNLRYRLENSELEIDKLRNARAVALSTSAASPERDSTPDRPQDHNRELKVEERESGEGSENAEETPYAHAKGLPAVIQPTFEQLLNTQLSDDASIRSGELGEESSLRSLLTASEKHNKHLTVLLNESEASVLRLTEQASVLKGEIRRLERNQERENSISNMEYLKNVVYKFLTLKGGKERMQLIPVLMTMLKFSPDEKDVLVALASGTDGSSGGNAGGEHALGGWGSYLNRWSGGLV